MEELLNNFDTLNIVDNMNNELIHEYDINPNFITEFLTNIKNDKQYDILLKLFSGYSGNMYLDDYIEEDDSVYIKILGCRNSKGREKYTIKISDYSFNCNCKDFAYRCKKEQIVCKHISFLMCKVGKIFDYNFFDTRKLLDTQVNILKSILRNNVVWKNRELSIKNINSEFNCDNKTFNHSDSCPICYEFFGDKNDCLTCPTCKNYIHKNCMTVWLETNKTCVYCRSSSFKNYISDLSLI